MEPSFVKPIKPKTVQTPVVTTESKVIRIIFIAVTVIYLSVFLLLPLATIFMKAFERGMNVYIAAITDSEAVSAIRLTIIVALIVVPLNTIFGVAAAWLITKFRFRGKQFLLSLIELPFAVSPVIAGLVFVLLFTPRGELGAWLMEHGVRLIFSVPGIVIATVFVTFPFVARELIPVMEAQGTSEEEAALSLGASGWNMFFRVTLPNIKWGLLYGMILCNARAIGEFGAVSVVSGHVRGVTNTMPLHIEILYNEYQFSAAFAVASLMSLLAIVTLIIKNWIEWKGRQ
ncbi:MULTISPECIES: sulfate ABC transporter permease subunit CysW [unclassified Bacillus (in: firmicutes)]|uniref:sulfate ABC transporter permease subunit CysW n=1 Tax=unclassified Bacillus (in: firmicutes) TaxID=185979 RepID=UPI0008E6A88E|nr:MULTISPECIES: sulfate ABC transporter permease subunit CysW [unclassified Bacillus (in: firmicutes)]SFJ05534.1 sulfate transport system permease protein [Bacillus sp. 71mf]SFS68120.1 sulfate transport system permease protein [Bacillus sp. 103mf]